MKIVAFFPSANTELKYYLCSREGNVGYLHENRDFAARFDNRLIAMAVTDWFVKRHTNMKTVYCAAQFEEVEE